MSTEHLAWATEQSQVSPPAKLLAIFLANYHGIGSEMTFRLEDAAAWCCGSRIENIDMWLGELEKEAGLRVMRRYDVEDKYNCEATVVIPEAKNGGHIL